MHSAGFLRPISRQFLCIYSLEEPRAGSGCAVSHSGAKTDFQMLTGVKEFWLISCCDIRPPGHFHCMQKLKLRIGTKLGLSAVVGLALVAAMVGNQARVN